MDVSFYSLKHFFSWNCRYEHYPELQDLSQMHNVIISSHVAFYTDEAVRQITQKTLENFEGFTGIMELDEKAFVA